MTSRVVQLAIRAGFVLAALTGGLTGALRAQAGRISGTVTDQSTGSPLEGARVVVIGTSIIETTNEEGKYTVRSIPPGSYQVRTLRIGYKALVQSVTVGPSETAALDFGLTPAPVELDEIVTTATGEQRKLEVANAIATIDAARVTETQPITEVGNLLSGRAAGVQVLKSGGTTGTGTRIRIRGSNSISLSNEPLYYIDGVRMESNSTALSIDVGGGIGGGATSAINDLNPEDIEDIEIVKGPAAATLYGIQASNGVVRITTKRGRAGRARWNFFVEQGAVQDRNDYPLNYFGRSADPVYDGFCTLQDEFDGNCSQTGITRYSPLRDPATRPLKAGYRQQYGANVSGGTEMLTYYLAADYESEDGVFRLPAAEEDSIRTARGSVPETQIRPNAITKSSLRLNLGANVARNAELGASVGYVSSDVRLIENDNSFLTVTGSGEASSYLPDYNRGWYYIPAELFAATNTQEVERFTAGLTGSWRPNGWLSFRSAVGYDVVNRVDGQFFPTNQVADYLSNRAGVRRENRLQVSQTSVDLGATVRARLSSTVGSKTSAGAQYFRNLNTGTFLAGFGLSPGASTITGAALTQGSSQEIEERSIGTFVEEEISFRDRLFVTGALRFDDHSAFGKNFNATAYPKASASWLISEEPFFRVGWLNTLRLRSAFGVSGRQPGTVDALRYSTQIAAKKDGTGIVGASAAALGNPDLKPERSRELEIGADAQLFTGRVAVELTFYTKRTTDGLVARDVDPGTGIDQPQFVNAATSRERGFEFALDTRILDRPNFIWDLTLSGSTTSSKLLDLGSDDTPIPFGFYQRHQVGYPLGGYWSKKLTGFADTNGDGIIDNTEYSVTDSLVFIGSALPTKELSLNTGITVFNGQFRLGAQFDYRGGHKVDNAIENFRCTPVFNCRGLYDRTASLEEQAKAQAVVNEGGNNFGFFEDGWFIKLRELSLTWNAPARLAGRLGASRLSVTLAARNLWTITDYSGVDPEVNAFGQSNFASSDFESQPQVTTWLTRVALSF
jgi:TonB-linked SusC/RagA family outer membrane protein